MNLSDERVKNGIALAEVYNMALIIESTDDFAELHFYTQSICHLIERLSPIWKSKKYKEYYSYLMRLVGSVTCVQLEIPSMKDWVFKTNICLHCGYKYDKIESFIKCPLCELEQVQYQIGDTKYLMPLNNYTLFESIVQREFKSIEKSFINNFFKQWKEYTDVFEDYMDLDNEEKTKILQKIGVLGYYPTKEVHATFKRNYKK